MARKESTDQLYSGSAAQALKKEKTARVFVCWSGARSLAVAKRFGAFIEKVIPDLKKQVFISTQLEKGVRWFEEIVRQLEGAQAGILCLTAENFTSPWLHFEAGALAKGLQKPSDSETNRPSNQIQNRIFTYLHGATTASLAGPLEQYQSTSTTREDTWSLIKALVGLLFPGNDADESLKKSLKHFKKFWPAFERDLKGITVPVQELLPEFERWFRRKTFEEPLQQCTDQNWPRRYDGARETHNRLSVHLASIRAACPHYQVDLYERLLTAVDSYAMDISALLLKPQSFNQPFDLGDDGELMIEPKGILRACENHREHVREIVSRILDPMAVPVTEEAAVFWLTDSSEQRKMLVHRYEHVIALEQKQRNRTSQHNRTSEIDSSPANASMVSEAESPYWRIVAALSDVSHARDLFKNVWDLDRILGYLAMEYFFPGDPEAVDSLRRAIVSELELFRAKREGATHMPMPLYYAVGALKAALNETDKIPEGLEQVLREILDIIQESAPKDRGEREPTLDKDKWLRREIEEITQLLHRSVVS